jgi:hypothetical protein
MIAIVQSDDFACGGAREARDELRGWLRLPIEANARPSYDVHIGLARDGEKQRTSEAVRRAHNVHRISSNEGSCTGFEGVENGAAAALQFVSDGFPAKPDQVRMRIGVIAKSVAA